MQEIRKLMQQVYAQKEERMYKLAQDIKHIEALLQVMNVYIDFLLNVQPFL